MMGSVSVQSTLWAGWTGFSSWLGRWWDFFSSSPPLCPNPLWIPSSLLSNGYRGNYSGGEATEARSWPLTSTKFRC